MGFKSILDPSFRYRDAASTDVRKTFERIKRQQRFKSGAQKNDAVKHAPSSKVVGVIAPARRKSA